MLALLKKNNFIVALEKSSDESWSQKLLEKKLLARKEADK